MAVISQTFTVEGLTITVVKENDRITDIRIPVSEAARNRFLTLFKQKNITPETTCYTGLLNDGLIEYAYQEKLHATKTDPNTQKKIAGIMHQLEKCIAPFVTLEKLINNATKNSEDSFAALNGLKAQVNASFTSIMAELEIDKTHALYHALENNKKNLLNSIEMLREKIPDAADLQQLFCIQDGAIDGTGEIHSLGTYIANQLVLICDHGINEIYSATENRLSQAFFMHPAIKVLSDVKSHLEIRGLSLKGAREENSLTPIPADLLEVINHNAEKKEELISTDGLDEGPQKELSLAPYLNHFGDVEEINRMIDTLANSQQEQFNEHPLEWSLIAEIFVTNLLEYIPATLHFCTSIVSFLGEGVCWFLNVTTATDRYGMAWLDDAATHYHHQLSPVRWYKNKLKQDYISHYDTDGNRQALIVHLWDNANVLGKLNGPNAEDHQKNGEYSTLNLLCSLYSGHKMAAAIGDAARGAMKAVKKVGIKFSFVFLVHSNVEERTAVFTGKKREIVRNWETLQKEFKKALEENNLASLVKKENHDEKKQALEKWSAGTPWAKNESPSIFDIIGEFCGTADKFIGPISRHRPGSATLFFGFSCASLSVLLHPALSAQPSTAWIGSVSTWLLKNFTGKAVTDGIVAKVMAVFLQWEILVLTYEAGTELATGNVAFLRQLFKDLDRTTFIVLVLVGGGASLQLLHDYNIELPAGLPASLANPTHSVWVNQYLQFSTHALAILPALVNTLARESAQCSQGHFPFLEYLVLGIKLGLVVQSAFSGKKDIPVFNSVSVIKAMMEDDVDWISENAGKSDVELAQRVKERLQKEGITPPLNDEKFEECVAAFVHAIKGKLSGKEVVPQHQEKKQEVNEKIYSPAQLKLKQVIQLVNEMRAQGKSGFDNIKQSWLFYDYLNDCFDEYNTEVRQHGLKEINKENYLNAFRIQYCDKGEVMLFRLFSLVPFYPVTLLWRGVNYIASDSAYIKDNIAHSFNKDAAMVIQVFSDLIRPVREFSRTISYVLRVALAIPLIIGSPFEVLFSWLTERPKTLSTTLENNLAWTTGIRLHHFTGTRFLKARYAKLARETNTNEESSSLEFFGDQVLHHVDAAQGKCSVQTQTTWQTECENLLAERNESANKYWRCSTHTINKAVERVGSILSSSLSTEIKKEKAKKVMLQLGNTSDLETFRLRATGKRCAPAVSSGSSSFAILPSKN